MLKSKSLYEEQGFTLLHFLFAFSIFMLIVSFFPILIKLAAYEKSDIQYNTALFFEFLQAEIVEADQLSTSGSTLYLYFRDGRVVSYQKYNTNIRRQVNGVGNEIFIQDVQDIDYMLVENGVIVSVKKEDRIKEKRISQAPILFSK